ncbi:MAG: hypothetical protein ABIB43_01105 [archaeon]
MVNNDTIDISLYTGEETTISTGLIENYTIIYAGMPNKDTFSIVRKPIPGFDVSGYNLFFPVNAKEIRLDEIELDVLKVTPESILLKYVIEKK